MGTYQNGTAVEIKETFGFETIPGDFSTFVPTDPTTVTFYVRDPDGTITSYVYGTDPEITNPSVGVYILTLDAPNVAGSWHYRCAGTGAVKAVIEGEFTVLPSSVLTPVAAEPTNGPCQAWCDAQDIVDCDSSLIVGSDTQVLEAAAYEASQMLYQLSGRQFAGRCDSVTVRPCADGCGCWPNWLFPGLSPGAPQFPVGAWGWWGTSWSAGAWGWGQAGCGCTPLSRALLPGYPVTSIVEVKIDGVVLDESEYRLDEYRWLTRMADADGNPQWWPGCQRLDLPDTEPGTWSCTYVHGVSPPALGVRAAAQLGAEIYKACSGGECALPAGTRQVTRAGVTIQKAPFVAWAQIDGRWATGLTAVDMFLSAYNPSGLTRRPVSWSPGGPKYARRIGT